MKMSKIRSASWTLIPALAVGLVACGPDRDKLAKEVHGKINKEMEAKIKREVEKRLRQELPRLEARLRARLQGKKLTPPRRAVASQPGDPAKSADPTKAQPTDPTKPEPAMTADPTATAKPAPDPKGLLIRRLVIAKTVKERAAFGVAKSFKTTDGQVYCYVDAVNAKGPKRLLQAAWLHNGKAFHRVKLRVGVGHVWRTWAKLRLRTTSVGSWQCAVSNEDGQLLGRAEFTVE